MNQQGTIGLVLGLAFLVLTAIGMGFVVGAVTDASRSADLRTKANEYISTPTGVIDVVCKKTIRWYSIKLGC